MRHVTHPFKIHGPRPGLRYAPILHGSALLVAWLFSVSAYAVSLSVLEEAACSGDRGLRVILDEAKPGYLQDESPEALRQYRARFYIRVDSLKTPDGSAFPIFGGFTGGEVPVVALSLKRVGQALRLGAAARLSSGTYEVLPDRGEVTIGTGWHSIELQWLAAKDLMNANGSLNLWFDGSSVAGLSGLANSTLQIDMVRLGALQNVTNEMSGSFDLDEFVSRSKGYIGATPTATGLPNVSVQENAPDTIIQLFPVFADAETADSALVLTVQNNTNEALFSAVSIDPATGALTLDYATGAFGEAHITIRATDANGLYVDSTFAVSVTEDPCDINNDGDINAVDVQLVINAALGLPVVGDTDINGDGPTNAVDVQLVINAALGITKKSP